MDKGWDGVDEPTRILHSLLRASSCLPDDGDARSLTFPAVVNLFNLMLRPGEKVLAYADRPGGGADAGSAGAPIDLICLTDMRMVRGQLGRDSLLWKELAVPVAVSLGMRTATGRATEGDHRWWIEDEPEPPRFFVDLPECLVLDGDLGTSWEWSAAETPSARRPVQIINAWSEALAKAHRGPHE
jgi:hypothetical protein